MFQPWLDCKLLRCRDFVWTWIVFPLAPAWSLKYTRRAGGFLVSVRMDSGACAPRHFVSLWAGACHSLMSHPGHWVWAVAPLSSLDIATLLFFILLMPTARGRQEKLFCLLCRLHARLFKMKGETLRFPYWRQERIWWREGSEVSQQWLGEVFSCSPESWGQAFLSSGSATNYQNAHRHHKADLHVDLDN